MSRCPYCDGSGGRWVARFGTTPLWWRFCPAFGTRHRAAIRGGESR